MHNKKIFLIATLIFSAWMLTGDTKNVKADEIVEEEEAVNDAEVEKDTSVDIRYTYKFSEGMEWIKSEKQSGWEDGYICVDKTGDGLLYVNDPDINFISPFSNGCSFIQTWSAVYQIDSNGNVINSYPISDNVTFKAYEDGGIWVEEYKADFDSAGYTYTLYDENGKEVTEFLVEGTEPISGIYYCGKGVWYYGTLNSNSDWVRRYYCTQSNKWVEISLSQMGDVYFYFS